MAAGRGRLMTLKIGNGASPEVFTTVDHLRTTSMTINNEMVDISTKDTNGWRELGENMGISTMSISVGGIQYDSTVHGTLESNCRGGAIDNYQITFDNGDEYEVAMQVTTFTRAGGYNDAETFDMTIESAGIPTFTPGA